MGLVEQLEHEQPILSDVDGCFKCSECRGQISSGLSSTVAQVLWTDGASSNNQDYRFRRAGSGIFYGEGHALNFSCFLPGLAQSNQRSELFAVLLACLRDPRELDIRSDSEYVCRGVHNWRTWVDEGWRGESADLWDMLASQLRARETIVTVSWVKGHAKKIDIDRGRTTWEDKVGNDGADELAVAVAKAHEIPSEVTESASLRKLAAKRVHGMMVCVLKARMAEEARLRGAQAAQDDTDDRGSDAGVCMCMDFSGVEALHVSDNELACACACHEFLKDECDEGPGTYHGPVQ